MFQFQYQERNTRLSCRVFFTQTASSASAFELNTLWNNRLCRKGEYEKKSTSTGRCFHDSHFGALGFSKPSTDFSHFVTVEKIPDTPKVIEIIKTVERAYDIEAQALYTI
jgi:hypothetical protein